MPRQLLRKGAGRRQRKADSERGAASRVAVHVDSTAVAVYDPFDEAEPEACACRARRPRGIGAEESFEDVRLHRRSNAMAGVADSERAEASLTCDADHYPPSLRRELYGVVHEVEHEALEPFRVALDHHCLAALASQIDRSCLRHALELFHQRRREGAEI